MPKAAVKSTKKVTPKKPAKRRKPEPKLVDVAPLLEPPQVEIFACGEDGEVSVAEWGYDPSTGDVYLICPSSSTDTDEDSIPTISGSEGEQDEDGNAVGEGGEEDEEGAGSEDDEDSEEDGAGDEEETAEQAVSLINDTVDVKDVTYLTPGIGWQIRYSAKGTRIFILASMKAVVDQTNPIFTEQMLSKHAGLTSEDRMRYFGRDDLTNQDDIRKAITQPWYEGAAIVESLIQKLRDVELPELKSHVRRVRFNDFDGDELDLDRLRNGQDYWRQSVREQRTGSTELTIFTDLTAGYYQNAPDLLWRGAAALALTERVEALGYRVELWAVHGGHHDLGDVHKPTVQAVCLKRPSDPLDISSLVQGVSAWFYRSAVLPYAKTQVIDVLKEQMVGGTFGYNYIPSQDDLDQISRDENRIYSAGVFSIYSAVELMKHELQKLRGDRDENG